MIRQHAAADGQATPVEADLVLSYSFDEANAADLSGNKNNGRIAGFEHVAGRRGKVFRFTGAIKTATRQSVPHHWTQDVPIFARAMVLAGDTLFIAGPPDLIDEQETFRKIDDPGVMPELLAQTAALKGEKGAILLAVSTIDGRELTRYKLAKPPVFDGMAGAESRLYMTTVDGQVICFAGDR